MYGIGSSADLSESFLFMKACFGFWSVSGGH